MIRKNSTEYTHEGTGIKAQVNENGTITFFNSKNEQYRQNHPSSFTFVNSQKATVKKVIEALGELLEKVPTPKPPKKVK